MFTGLVLGIGEVIRLNSSANETRLGVRPLFPLADYRKGESIAVNGACLSVEHFTSRDFTAYASHETLRLTTLGELRPGSRVNLERALALGDRLGGHLVSGHVDGIAIIESLRQVGSSHVIRARIPEEYSPQIIPKGSVALDGVSLTVNTCGPGFLEVNVIPETWAGATVNAWIPGTRVNLETDLIGKYVQRLVSPYAGAGNAGREKPGTGRLSLDFLRENGF